MTLHADDPGSLTLNRAARAPLDTLVRRDRERTGRLSPTTAEERIAAMRRIAARVAKLPVLDDRSPDEILGYDESGLPA